MGSTLLIVFSLIVIGLTLVSLLSYNFTLPSPYVHSCPEGECATNIYNGEKICPKEGERAEIKEFQVCNPAYSCQGITPYAMLNEATQEGTITSPLGICPEGEKCPCFKSAYCADYITTYFTVVGATPYENILDTTANVYQSFTYVNAADDITPFSPLSLPGETSFCSIPARWRDRLYPKYCLRGSLYYLTRKVSSFDPTRDTLSCIKEEPCAQGTPVFETSTRKKYCL